MSALPLIGGASCRRLSEQWSLPFLNSGHSTLSEQWPLYPIKKTCNLQHVSTPFHIPRFPESKSV